MNACQSNAMAIARYLEKHSAVQRVTYPGLESHPNHNIAKTQARGFGAMITFYLNGDIDLAAAFLSSLSLFILAESLGAVESLAESPAVMTHASVPKEIRKELGISDNMVRLSVGIENVDDLIADLEQALEKAVQATKGRGTGVAEK
jgi:cystathionine gamma-lyase